MTYGLKQLFNKPFNLLLITILLSFLHACGNKGPLSLPETNKPDALKEETIINDEL